MKNNWHWLNKVFHWLMALFILTALTLGLWSQYIDDVLLKTNIILAHKSIGITVLVLALCRLYWRLHVVAPSHTEHHILERFAASLTHVLLYILMIALPLSGWLMSNYAAYPMSWFGLVELPAMVSPDKAMAELAHEAHELMGWVLIGLLALHIAGALKHHAIDKDDVLTGMAGQHVARTLTLLAAGVAIAVWLSFPYPKNLKQTTTSTPTSENANQADTQPSTAATSNGELWQTESGTLSFTFTLNGGKISGQFKSFVPQLRFEGDKPTDFSVKIDLTSVDTQDDTRDGMLLNKEWFNTIDFPQAEYKAQHFIWDGTAETWNALGVLTIKNKRVATPLVFKLMPSSSTPNKVLLHGNAVMNRSNFNIGEGEWAADDVVGYSINITTGLVLQKP